MNLHQFRVLSAVLRLPDRFTTPDVVHEAGVSAEVVRKTYQRYERFFTVVAAAKPKVRSLTPAGREELLQELKQSRSHIPPPPVTRGPEGEPLGLAGAERVLYELVPVSNATARTRLLRETRSHIELADRERKLTNQPALSASVEVRLHAVRCMLEHVEVLHGARELLENRVPDAELTSVDTLATALINAAAAQEFSRQENSSSVRPGLRDILALRERAPEEATRLARALVALEKDPAWCKALGIPPGTFWTIQEEAVLKEAAETRLTDRDLVMAPLIDQPFAISVDRWDEAEHGDAPVRATAAFLRIAVRDKIATSHRDPWSRSVQDSARLSAYPLALWLASSWWRLRWDCRRVHEISEAGGGFVWPPLSLLSNGERILARCRAADSAPAEGALRYLENFEEWVPASDFEHATDSFIKKVLDRLASVGQTELAAVWQKLIAERDNPQFTARRRLEAMLGFKRDEAPEQILQELRDLASEAGPSSVDELAWANPAQNSLEMLTKTTELARSSEGVNGHIALSLSQRDYLRLPNEFPWDRGHRLAHACRKHFGFEWNPISDADLADTIHILPAELSDGARAPARGIGLGLAVRNLNTDKYRFLFPEPQRYTRRFYAARFLGDSLLAQHDDRWLLGTKAVTERQQAQRAFANEFLTPREALRGFLGEDRSDEKLEEAAVYWGRTSNGISRHVDLPPVAWH
jgi:hypothetical protein